MRRPELRPLDDHGAGSLLAVGIIAATVLALGMAVPLYLGLVVRQSVDAAADASALAGADVAAGISPGSPCAIAAELATANRATLGGCVSDGLVVTVRVSADFEGLSLVATATAGPPVLGTN